MQKQGIPPLLTPCCKTEAKSGRSLTQNKFMEQVSSQEGAKLTQQAFSPLHFLVPHHCVTQQDSMGPSWDRSLLTSTAAPFYSIQKIVFDARFLSF